MSRFPSVQTQFAQQPLKVTCGVMKGSRANRANSLRRMPRRGWLARARSARRESVLRSDPLAAVASRWLSVGRSSGALALRQAQATLRLSKGRTSGAIRQRRGSQGRKTPRRIAPTTFRRPETSGAPRSARSRALASQPRRGIGVRALTGLSRARPRRPPGRTGRIGPTSERRDRRQGLKRVRSGTDRRRRRFVPCGQDAPLSN